MRRTILWMATAAVMLVVAAGGYAVGAIGDNDGSSSSPSPRGTVPPADAKFARAAAFVNNEGPTLVRAKGFKSVTSPSPGIYCLRLKDKTLKVGQLTPMVSTEWGNSGGYDLLVQVYRAASDCPARSIEVMTFNEAGGSWEFYDNISFYVMVP